MHYKETTHGFEYGAAKIDRLASDDKAGWVIVRVETPKFSGGNGLQIYVTKTGKVRIFDHRGEWRKPVTP